MDKIIRVAAVSYLNTKPLLYGFEKGLGPKNMSLQTNYPSAIAKQLQQKQVDIGLVPVAILPHLSQYKIISSYCIGASKPVASVALFSHKPIEELDEILLDFQSKTSITLTQILCQYYWKKQVVFTPAQPNYIQQIKDNTGGIIIGDRALEMLPKFQYVYDLAEHWQNFTQLPFVFAAWVCCTSTTEKFELDFDTATGYGLQHLEEVIQQQTCSYYNLHTYYTQNIDYNWDEAKQQGLQLFLQYMQQFKAEKRDFVG